MRTATAWDEHVRRFREKHPHLSFKECLRRASATYHKGASTSYAPSSLDCERIKSLHKQLSDSIKKLQMHARTDPIYRRPDDTGRLALKVINAEEQEKQNELYQLELLAAKKGCRL